MQSPTSSQNIQKFTNTYPEVHKSINEEINKFIAEVGCRTVVGRRAKVGTTDAADAADIYHNNRHRHYIYDISGVFDAADGFCKKSKRVDCM